MMFFVDWFNESFNATMKWLDAT